MDNKIETEPEITEEELRTWIAERCGWTEIKRCTCRIDLTGLKPGEADYHPHLPDYTRDLNAMREAVTATFDARRFSGRHYQKCLNSVIRKEFKRDATFFEISNATALQRARAFHAATK